MNFKAYILCLFFTVVVFSNVNAHNPKQSYIYLQVYENSIDGRFEINIKELNLALGLNLEDDVEESVVKRYEEDLKSYYLPKVKFSSLLGNHQIKFGEIELLRVGKLGTFVQVNFKLDNITEIPDALNIYYNVLFEKTTDHQGLVVIEYNWKAGIHNNESITSLFFARGNIQQELDLTEGSIFKGFITLIKEGVWHIWIGLDHILFLLALVLPSVITRYNDTSGKGRFTWAMLNPFGNYSAKERGWQSVEKFKPAFMYIIKIVTFFTISHTITLSLAALNIVLLPSRFVESVIAISIALAAWNNFHPIFRSKEWIIAFGFGLFHGFGFASVLSDIGLSGDYLGLSLFGFNIGVELGQLAIISGIFPILYIIRKTKLYHIMLVFGSFLLIFISIYWFIERGFDIDLQLGNFLFSIYSSIFN